MNENGKPISVISGSSNIALVEGVSATLGLVPVRREIGRFPDGEIKIEIEETVRGRDVYLIQSTGPPVNENLMELLIMIDALHRASAGRITAVVPYYGYGRQDKMTSGREPITARLVADLLTRAGANRVVSIDLHNAAIQGFFGIWTEHLTAVPLLVEYLCSQQLENRVIVSPDTGRIKEADIFARALGLPLVVLYKRRLGPESTEVVSATGSVKGKRPIVVDDMISTGTTIGRAVDSLLGNGAVPEIAVVATHGLLTDGAVSKLNRMSIKEVVVTDTVPISSDKRDALGNIVVLSVVPLLAEAIRRLNREQSLRDLSRSFCERSTSNNQNS